jgi:hypothetical protein
VAFTLVQAMSVGFCFAHIVAQGDLPLIEHSQAYLAYLLWIDGAYIAANFAFRVGHPRRRLRSTSETGEK